MWGKFQCGLSDLAISLATYNKGMMDPMGFRRQCGSGGE